MYIRLHSFLMKQSWTSYFRVFKFRMGYTSEKSREVKFVLYYFMGVES